MKKELKKEDDHLETVTNKVGEIAVQYGFTVVKPPHITNSHAASAKQFKDFDYYGDSEEKISITHWYMDQKLENQGQPITIHYKKPSGVMAAKKKNTHDTYGFEIMGSTKSTSEALLVKCVLSILGELGYKNLCVDINSIGDRESIGRFERELGSYYRKHMHALPAKTRQDFKKNHYCILTDDSSENEAFRSGAPSTLGSLSDVARLHFKEVLESIEAFDVAYKIKSSVLSNKHYASYTVFEVRSDEELVAYGYRYNHLAKKLGSKRDIPSIGATIIVKKTPATAKKILIKNIKKPRFYLVQLGGVAKLKALNVVEMLRKEKIPVYHSITKDKITGQLSGAEYMHATHVLIMGQKEAIENTIVVRNIITRAQETVSLDKLPEFLKNLK